MAVDLSLFLGKNVEVTYRSGRTEIGIVGQNDSGVDENSHPYKFGEDERTFTKDGKWYLTGNEGYRDIVEVLRIAPSRYTHLEEQVAQPQAEIERLKAEEEAEKPKLPEGFCRKAALELLDGNGIITYNLVDKLFSWNKAPQGYAYWCNIALGCYNGFKPSEEALSYIREMVILSYRQQYGD